MIKDSCVHGFRLDYSRLPVLMRQEHSFIAPDETFLSSFRQGMMLWHAVSFFTLLLIGDNVRVFLPDNPHFAVNAIVIHVRFNRIRVSCYPANANLEKGRSYGYVLFLLMFATLLIQ